MIIIIFNKNRYAVLDDVKQVGKVRKTKYIRTSSFLIQTIQECQWCEEILQDKNVNCLGCIVKVEVHSRGSQ